MLCTYMRQLTKSYTMSFSIEALAFHAPVTCCTFVEHDSFSRTKEMVKSLECQNVDQNQYFNFSSGYMACNARQGIVSNNSSCLLKKNCLVSLQNKNQISIVYPNFSTQFVDCMFRNRHWYCLTYSICRCGNLISDAINLSLFI